MLTIALYAGLLVVGFLIGKAVRKYMYGEIGSDKIGDFARQPRRMKKAPQPTQAEIDARETEVNIALTLSGNLYKKEDLDFLHRVGGLDWAAPTPVNLTKNEAQKSVAKAKYFIKLNKLHMGVAPGDCDCAWTLGGIIDWYNPECESHGHLAMRPKKKSKHLEQYDDFMLGCTCTKCVDSDNPGCSFGCPACHDEEYQRKLNEHEEGRRKKTKAKPNRRLIRDVTA
jgi:hypothetical protein